jgi:hypothetical protein
MHRVWMYQVRYRTPLVVQIQLYSRCALTESVTDRMTNDTKSNTLSSLG